MRGFVFGRACPAVLAGLALLLAGGPPAAAAAPVDWGRAFVEATMERFPDAGRMPWRYGRALFLEGAYLVHRRTGDRRYLAYVKRWAEAHVRADGTVVESDGTPVAFTSLDSLMPGGLLAILHRHTRDARYRLAAQRMRAELDTWPRTTNGGFWHTRRSTGQLWADGAFMATSLLLEYGRSFPDGGRSADEAARQLLAYAEKLQNPVTGLPVHAYSEPRTAPWADPATGRSPEVWCRAVGWFGVALVRTLAALPADHPRRAALLRVLRGLAAGLGRRQDLATGRWFQVLDRGQLAANWLETSCSALNALTLSRAARRGWIAATYQENADRGYRGVLAMASVRSDGLADLAGTVVGTSVGDLAYYLARPRQTNDFHGLGAFLLLHEHLAALPGGA